MLKADNNLYLGGLSTYFGGVFNEVRTTTSLINSFRIYSCIYSYFGGVD
jgi:hypothetical protein